MKKITLNIIKQKCTLLLLVCLSINYNAEAQFLKKLKQKAERVLGGKKNNEAKETNKQFENMLGELEPSPINNNIKLPENYMFSYQATIQVKNNNGTINTQYLLQPLEAYYAKNQATKDYIEYVVYDINRNVEVYFVESKEEKKMAHKKMDPFTKIKLIGAYKDSPNKQIKTLGSKKLLGYNCKGYEISTQAGITQLWVTNEAPVTLFTTLFKNRTKDPNSPFTTNTMIMEATFTSNKYAEKDYQMICTQLEAKKIVFNTTDYKD